MSDECEIMIIPPTTTYVCILYGKLLLRSSGNFHTCCVVRSVLPSHFYFHYFLAQPRFFFVAKPTEGARFKSCLFTSYTFILRTSRSGGEIDRQIVVVVVVGHHISSYNRGC